MERLQDRLTLDEIAATLQDKAELDKLELLYCVSVFYGGCLPSDKYEASVDWMSAIVPTAAGRKLIDQVPESLDYSAPDTSLAILLSMFHRELLVDLERTDLDRVLALLSCDVRDRNIIYPWIYTRDLFDRFFRLFSPQRENLEPHEVMRLTDGMEQGVFQLGGLIVGPFGVLPSRESRFLPPTRDIGLRLCSDPTCDHMHPCELLPFECGPARVLKKMTELSEEYHRDSAIWRRFMRKRLRPDRSFFSHTSRTQLGLLLATAFTRDELTLVLEELIATNSDLYRRAAGPIGDGTERVSANARDYSRRLNQAQLLQQILRSTDANLVATVDHLIEQRQIIVPPTEIRGSRFQGASTFHQVTAECSHLGLRFLPEDQSFGPRRLVNLISSVHDNLGSWPVLNFALRRFEGEAPADRLVRYLSSIDPREALEATLFMTEQHVEVACDALGFEHYSSPVDESAEERLISGMLWKMGFGLPTQPSMLSTIRTQLEALLVETRVQETYSFAQEERVRSVAVNAFVTLEGVLTEALNFSGWVLLKDHFLDTKFNYRESEAREFVHSVLNGFRVGDGPVLEFSHDGRNTLFPLIEGFTALAELCGRVAVESLAHQRQTDTIPPQEEWTQLSPFPLKHDKLLLDVRPAQLAVIIELLRDIARTLNRANVLGVRNRLSHSGREFPQRPELEDVVHAVNAVVDVLENSGLYPVVYDRKSRTTDVFGRGLAVYENYRRAQVKLIRPSYISSCRMPDSISTLIIVPCLTLGPASEPVRFRLLEHSPYGDLWASLPPRRPDSGADSVLTGTNDYTQTPSIGHKPDSVEGRADWQ